MLIIPAIDIKDGHCVRLKQGDMQAVTVFPRILPPWRSTGWSVAPSGCTSSI